MSYLREELVSYLDESGESMRSLSIRSGLNAKAVSDILTVDGLRPTHRTVEALSASIGRSLPTSEMSEKMTYAALIRRITDKVEDEGKARRLCQRVRWLLREAGWVAELKQVDRAEVLKFFSGVNAATFGIGSDSLATYKSEILKALDVATPRARARNISDVGGFFGHVHEAVVNADIEQDYKLIAGSFFVYLQDQEIAPAAVTTDVLEEYYRHRIEEAGKTEGAARKHVKRIAALLRKMASDPELSKFGFAAPAHPFFDQRDKYGVPDATIASLLDDFDQRIAPWAQGKLSNTGQTFSEFVAWLDSQEDPTLDPQEAKLAKLLAKRTEKKRDRSVSLADKGFLPPNARWSDNTLATRRGYVAARAKALYARTGYLVDTIEKLCKPQVAWSIATALVEANETGFQSGYAASVMKTIFKIARNYVGMSAVDVAEFQDAFRDLASERGMSERNIAKLREFSGDRIKLFMSVADRILVDVKARSERRRAVAKRAGMMQSVEKYDLKERRDIMCALAHDILLARAPRSANVIGIRLEWIRWTGKRATIVVPSTSIKMRGARDPDLDIELGVEASGLLYDYLTVVRPLALQSGDEENPYLFPGQGSDAGKPYQNLLLRLVSWVFEITGAQMNPHLYRHMIGWIWLREDITKFPIVQKLLGHRDIQTTLDYYAKIDASLAMGEWQKVVTDAKRQKP